MQVQTGTVGVSDYPHGDWWTGSGPREVTKHITLSGFNRAPKVVAAISSFDISGQANARVNVTVENVSSSHADIRIATWADTRIASITVSWIAIG
jgi:hypothetical protein